MRKKQYNHLALLITGLLSAGLSHAAILYSAPPNQSGGSDLNAFLEADDVTFATSVQINQVKFWSLQGTASDYAGSIDWSINLNAAGVPGAPTASGSSSPAAVPTGNSAFGLNEFSYTFPVNVALSPGTYWLVLHNGPVNTIPTTDFFWEWSNGNAGNSQSQDLSVANSPWLGNFSELAFELQGDVTGVPEPGSMLLFGTGLLSAWFMRRRQKN